jgi:ketosteroid isomerase-like protein
MFVKRYLLATVAALMFSSSSSALAIQSYSPFSDPHFRAVLMPVQSVISALGTANVQSLRELYSPDAVVIDDVGSLRWNGTTAGSDWLSNVTGKWSKFGGARFADSHLADISLQPQTAYVVVYGTITSKTPVHGSFTFTLSKASGSWKITSQTFSPLYGLRPLQR